MSNALERARKWDAAMGVDDAVARAVAEERAAVVAWLREYEGHSSLASLFALMADTIELGEHRREEEK